MEDRIRKLESQVEGLLGFNTNFDLNYPNSVTLKQALQGIKDLEEGIENASKTFGDFQIRHNTVHERIDTILKYHKKLLDSLSKPKVEKVSFTMSPPIEKESFLSKLLKWK